ncbi:hypothetical protein DQW50_04795 [Halorubrum sp. 48-1-W]|uniref:hypothetical protein n=1 Tax=Halorubrum sp. 48-1-W TaxID=2249761 RepID=UPI000DCBF122|nr:hypothetical protein [Halorubrum sp. 48-1-W]RAW46099.1 hypothetical protein DQW50_04795 [Halorubrum sp. 48-1-W]
MTRLSRLLLGEAGFERAAVWSATGFALAFLAVDAVAPAAPLAPTPVAVACVAVAAVGVAGFARVGGGLLPSALLAYGPVAGALLGRSGPEIRLVAGGGITVGPGSGGTVGTALALVEPLALALAGAVAVGGVGYAVGHGLRVVGDRGAEADAGSEPVDD